MFSPAMFCAISVSMQFFICAHEMKKKSFKSLEAEIAQLVNIDGYDFISKCRQNRTHGGGVGLYALNNHDLNRVVI
jgi:hypothetical protein